MRLVPGETPGRVPIPDLPLAPLQEAMVLEHLAKDDPGLNLQQLVGVLREPVDPALLHEAWRRVTRRHEVLRTRFLWGQRENPVQQVLDPVDVPFHFEDWQALSAEARETRRLEYLRSDRARGMSLDRAPLHRLALFRFADDLHEVVWTFHHAILDGRSCTRVVREALEIFAALRDGRDDAPCEVPRFADYLGWVSNQDQAPARQFWMEYLRGWTPGAGIANGLEPLGGGDRVPVEAAVPDSPWIELDMATTQRLTRFAEDHGLTPNTVLMGAWALLLHHHAGCEDVVFGAIRAGRSGHAAGAGDMVGLLIQCVPVRVGIRARQPVVSWLQDLRRDWLRMRPFEHVSPVTIHEWIGHPGAHALFDTLVVFERESRTDHLRRLGGDWIGRRFRTYQRSSFAAALSAFGGSRISLQVAVDPRRFPAIAARRLLERLVVILEGLVADPARPVAHVPFLPLAERQRLMVEWNPAPRGNPVPSDLLLGFESHARSRPGALAVEHGARRLEHGELNARANQLAHALRARGIGPGSLVAIEAERSLEQIVGLLAVLKAGAGYVPFDREDPPGRFEFAMTQAGVQVALFGTPSATAPSARGVEAWSLNLASWAWRDQPDSTPALPACDDAPAYVIYTSGSAGRPKGVVIPRRALARYVASAIATYELSATDRVLQFATLCFDASVEEIIPILDRGGTLVLRDHRWIASIPAFLRACQDHRVSVLGLPTAFWHELVGELAASDLPLPSCIRQVIIGGERALPERGRTWLSRHPEHPVLLNTYGPTEGTIVATVFRVSADRWNGQGEIPIGRPLPHVRAYVLGPEGEVVPTGVAGELHLGGEALASGYLHQPELTADRFIPDPFSSRPGDRLYRTGDRARWLESGCLEFLGRADDQVKIRGFRVELGEIESALASLPEVHVAVVKAVGDQRDHRELVAWVVPTHGSEPNPAALRGALAALLPTYQIPGRFIVVPDLPLTPSGKIDRAALVLPDVAAHDSDADFDPPRTELEVAVARLWQQLLRRDRVGLRDHFFHLGGHSLLAFSLVARLRPILRQEIPVHLLFQHPVLADFVRAMASRVDRTGYALTPTRLKTGARSPSLVFVHPVAGSLLPYLPLAELLHPDESFLAFAHPGLLDSEFRDASLHGLASAYLQALLRIQPQGPFFLGGWSLGGVLAFEMARQLLDLGHSVAFLALVDSQAPPSPSAPSPASSHDPRLAHFDYFLRLLDVPEPARLDAARFLDFRQPDDLLPELHRLLTSSGALPDSLPLDAWTRAFAVYSSLRAASRSYRPGSALPASLPITLFRRSEHVVRGARSAGWERWASAPLRVFDVPGDHDSMIRPPHLATLARLLQRELDAARRLFAP